MHSKIVRSSCRVDRKKTLFCFTFLTFNYYFSTEADRDILDWSGKKPLDYQKQLTAHQLSSATFSSEYKFITDIKVSGVQTLPSRQSSAKKLRSRDKVKRSLTLANESGASRGSSFDSGKSNVDFDTKSLTGENLDFSQNAPTKRKEKKMSYLKRSMTKR